MKTFPGFFLKLLQSFHVNSFIRTSKIILLRHTIIWNSERIRSRCNIKFQNSLFYLVVVLLIAIKRIRIRDGVIAQEVIVRAVGVRRMIHSRLCILTEQRALEQVPTHDGLEVERIHRKHLRVEGGRK